MNNIDKIKICKTRNVKTPSRGTSVAAGLDFYVPYDLTQTDMENMFNKTGSIVNYNLNDDGYVTEMSVGPGQSVCIPSGIKAKIPDGYCMEFHNKSGIACKKSLLCGAQLIDQDYTGEWHIDVHNVSGVHSAIIKAGDKIAQFVMYKVEYPTVDVIESEELLFVDFKTERGDGAFGSTGEK